MIHENVTWQTKSYFTTVSSEDNYLTTDLYKFAKWIYPLAAVTLIGNIEEITMQEIKTILKRGRLQLMLQGNNIWRRAGIGFTVLFRNITTWDWRLAWETVHSRFLSSRLDPYRADGMLQSKSTTENDIKCAYIAWPKGSDIGKVKI